MRRAEYVIQNPWFISFMGISLVTLALSGCNKEPSESSTPISTESKIVLNDNILINEIPKTSPTPGVQTHNNLDCHAVVSVDFLYWQFKENQLVYAANADSTTPSHYALKNAPSDWAPGFRLGIGGYTEYDNWDIMSNWTHWNHVSKQSTYGTGTVVPMLASPLTGVASTYSTLSADSANSRFSLNFNTLDLVLGRSYMISKRINLRPYFGLEAASIYQMLNVTYSNVVPEMGATAYNKFNGHNNFLGLGLKTGLNARWEFTRHFGLFGNLAGSLLWGNTKAYSKVSNTSTVLSQNGNQHGIKPAVQMALGLDWGKPIGNDFYLKFAASYEIQNYFSQLVMPTLNTTDKAADLSSQGLTLNIRFDF